MKYKWRELSLGEITELVIDHRGKTPKKLGGDWSKGGYRALSAKNIKTGRIVQPDTIRFVREEMYHKLMKDEIQQGDIIITSEAPFGQVLYWDSKEKVVLSQRLFGVRIREEYDSRFVYYYMTTSDFQGEMAGRATGTTVVGLRQPELLKCVVRCPDLETQKRIATILASIDEKILINEQINENLQQQLHVLYLRLFCDSAMDTPLGDVVATTSGGTPSRKHDEYYSDSSICWVKSKELLGNYIHETEEHINDLAIKKSSAKLLPKHSVLIAMYGATVGAYGVISKPMTCNQAVCALLCNENYPYTYLFQIAYESQQKFINLAVGSAQQNISQVLIKQLNLHSDLDIIQRFHDLALPMHQEIEFLQAENISLSNLRNKLLPKLMSGELDVSSIDL